MHDHIRATRLVTLVTVESGEPLVSHVPMLLDPTRGPLGTLRCHLARANPQARALAEGQRALAIFLGPNAYVTPSWYASKREHGKVVPTWYYTAVHASGPVRVVDDARGLLELVDALTKRHESPREEPWHIGDAPERYVSALLNGIVGLEIEIALLNGKWKLDQERPAGDVAGVAAGLAASSDPIDRATAEAMRRISGSE